MPAHDHDHEHDHAEPAARAPTGAPVPHAAHAGHGHGDLRATPTRRLAIALGLTALSMIAEIVAGVFSHSLALLSDAGHLFADGGALVLALFAQRIAARPRSAARTYGSRRAESMAALANSVALLVTSVWVVVEAASRWRNPPDVRGGWMLAVATSGLACNVAAARVLGSASGEHNANTRAALAHVLSDIAGSAAAIGAALLVITLHWRRADPAISIVLAVLIAFAAWKLIRQTTDVLMEGAPSGLNVADLERTILGTPGVARLHDLHAWRVSEGFDVVTVHVVLDGSRHGPDVSRAVAQRVASEHAIAHTTVQAESPQGDASLVPADELVRRRP